MKENYNEIYINSLVFNDDPIEIIKQSNEHNYDILIENLNIYINQMKNMQFLDEYMKENIYNIINYIRENYNYSDKEDKKNKYELYNSLVQTINTSLQTNTDYFYLSQSLERGIYIEYGLKDTDISVPEKLKNDIRNSLSYDKYFYDILTKNNLDCSTDQFKELIMNVLFLYSVNYFKMESPEILTNNYLLRSVLLANKKIIESFEYKFNSKYEKSKSLKKYTKTLLKEIF